MSTGTEEPILSTSPRKASVTTERANGYCVGALHRNSSLRRKTGHKGLYTENLSQLRISTQGDASWPERVQNITGVDPSPHSSSPFTAATSNRTMTTRTQQAFDEMDMQDLSIGHKLREAKRFAEQLEKDLNNALDALQGLI